MAIIYNYQHADFLYGRTLQNFIYNLAHKLTLIQKLFTYFLETYASTRPPIWQQKTNP